MNFIFSTLLDEKKCLQECIIMFVCKLWKSGMNCVYKTVGRIAQRNVQLLQRLAFAYFARNNYLKTPIIK